MVSHQRLEVKPLTCIFTDSVGLSWEGFLPIWGCNVAVAHHSKEEKLLGQVGPAALIFHLAGPHDS